MLSMKTLIISLGLLNAVLSYAYPHACQNTSRSDGGCYVCNNRIGFTNDGLHTCINTSADDCFGWDEFGYCIACPPGLVPWGSNCKYPIDRLCANYNTDGTCYYCISGYYPDQGVCVAGNPVANCAFAASGSACMFCNPGFYMFNGACVALPSGCAMVSGPRCTACAAGYSLVESFGADGNGRYIAYAYDQWVTYGNMPTSSSSCVPSSGIPNCVSYVSNTVCAFCAPNFYLNAQGTCTRNPELANCANFTINGACARCINGFYLSNGACVGNPITIPDCLAYSSPIYCSRCATGYYVNSNLTCSVVSRTIAGCVVYDTSSTCRYCNGTFYAFGDGTTCVSINSSIANCYSYYENTCALCNSGYYLTSSGQCVAVTVTVANCDRYGGNGNCTYCAGNFYLRNNTCVSNSIANCAIMASIGTCQYCATGYYPDSSRTFCAAITTNISGCMYYQTATTCAMCMTNYQLGFTNTTCAAYSIADCQRFSNDTQCVYCTSGYFYNAEINFCNATALVSNCVRYNSSDTCIWCANNYYISTRNVCTSIADADLITNCAVYSAPGQCFLCQTNYYPSDTKTDCFTVLAVNKVSNCNFYNPDGLTCYECNANFYLDANTNRTCFPVKPVYSNCDSYWWNNTCMKCLGNSTLDNAGNCVSVTTTVANCWWYYSVALGSGCQYCLTGYYPNTTTSCAANSNMGVANCKYFGAYMSCAVCLDGYYASNGACLAVSNVISNCAYYNGTNSCALCYSGWYLVNNACFLPANFPNCKFYFNAYVCAVCNPGFYLTNTGCQPGTAVANCIEWWAPNQCNICATSTYLGTDRTCVTRGGAIANCIYYATATSCMTCATGFFPSGNLCNPVTTVVTNCVYYTNNGVCMTCASGSIVSASGQCISNCEAGSNGFCTRCAPNYFYNPGTFTCVSVSNVIQNCRYYASASQCATCSAGYYLSSNTCVFDGAASANNCAAISPSICLVCAPGYYNRNNEGNCVAVMNSIDGCVLYDPRGGCDLCDSFHMMYGPTRTCVPLPEPRDCYCYAGVTWAW